MDPQPQAPYPQAPPLGLDPQPVGYATQSLFPPEAEQHNAGAKGLSLAIALGINALILMALAWWTISHFQEEQIELVVETGKLETVTKVDKKEFQQKQQVKPQPPSGSKAPPVIAASVADPNTVFIMQTNVEVDAFGIGDGWGAGSGFGGSGGGGGTVGFFGSRSNAQRVVFIIDVSASLSSEQFALIKSELTKSLNKLAPAVQYQVIFFSGPAWFAEDEQTGKSRGKRVVKHGGKNYQWDTKGGANQFYLVGKKDLYTAKWIQANRANLNNTIKRIDAVSKSYGTDWRHPLQMALEMNPKPDVVYFLTDGVVGNGQQAVDQTLRLNKRKSPKAKFNTIIMMQPKAEDLMGELAESTGGEFTVVKADGTVVRGKKTRGTERKKKKKN